MTKAFVDNAGGVREKLIQIRNLARQLGEAAAAGRVADLPSLVDAEWRLRRTLASGVSTPQIEAMMARTRSAGALANKICGAGGGGCMITVVEPENRRAVEQAVVETGGQLMPFKVSLQGVTVS